MIAIMNVKDVRYDNSDINIYSESFVYRSNTNEKFVAKTMSPYIINVNDSRDRISLITADKRYARRFEPAKVDVSSCENQIDSFGVAICEIVSFYDDISAPNTYENTIKRIDYQSISLNVGGSVKPTMTNDSKENGIKSISLELQKQNYFEFSPVLSNKIIAVVNLPYGVLYDSQKIKGSPSNAGYFKSNIILENGEMIDLNINISNIQRVL